MRLGNSEERCTALPYRQRGHNKTRMMTALEIYQKKKKLRVHLFLQRRARLLEISNKSILADMQDNAAIDFTCEAIRSD